MTPTPSRCSPTRVAALHDGLALILRGQELLAARPQADRPPCRHSQVRAWRPRRALVDDSPVTLRVHADLLRRAGFEVRGARDGADALDMLRAAPVDVIVSDVDMAPMDGLVLLRAVRDDPATAELPFVFVSARPPTRSPAACGGLHVDAVVSKGVVEQQLPGTRARRAGRRARAPAPACSWPRTRGSCAR